VLVSYGDTRTSQLFVLADFANISAQLPDRATKYTADQEKCVNPPALAGFTHTEQIYDMDLMNKDYASLTNVNAPQAAPSRTPRPFLRARTRSARARFRATPRRWWPDEANYQDARTTGLALEFISPIKGPNLEKILVQVGSGITKAAAGAALYDQDVKAEAEQLNLPGG